MVKEMTRKEALRKIVTKAIPNANDRGRFVGYLKAILDARPRASSEATKAIKAIEALPLEESEKQALVAKVKAKYNNQDNPEAYKKASWVLSQVSVLYRALTEED